MSKRATRLSLALMLVPFVLFSCGGKADSDTRPARVNSDDSEQPEPPQTECEMGEELNEDSTCVPVGCQEGAVEISERECGRNLRGREEQVCRDGAWIRRGTCVDPDECYDEETESTDTICGPNDSGLLQRRCDSGMWRVTDICIGADECVDDETEFTDVFCGFNGRGFLERVCVQGAWEMSDVCIDPDECVSESVREGEQTCLPGEGASLAICVDGHWGDAECRDVFVSTWDTTLAVDSEETVALPLVEQGTYDFYVYWGDGSGGRVTAFDSPEATHQYDAPGEYRVEIFGTIEGWDIDPVPLEALEDIDAAWDHADGPTAPTRRSRMLTEISRWGPLALGDTNSQFAWALNLRIRATDAPDLSGTTTLRGVFLGCVALKEPDLSEWDLGGIDDLSFAFLATGSLRRPNIGSWNTSAITSMSGVFAHSNFSGDISGWDTSSVTDMSHMFYGTRWFNGDISGWDTSSVTDMSHMFGHTDHFNQDISGWDTGRVTDMSSMFMFAFDFNQPIGTWNTSQVLDMSRMFYSSSLDQDISAWDTSNVANFSLMFNGAWSFSQDLAAWDVTSAQQMHRMLHRTRQSTAHYDALLISWAAQAVQPGVSFSTDLAYSSAAVSARSTLTDVYGWTIDDGGLAP